MSRKVPKAGSRHATPAPTVAGASWTAAIACAMVLAAALAWMTSGRSITAQPLPMSAKAPRAGLMDAGQRITIDPATGQARPTEHDDITPFTAVAAAETELQTVSGPNGAEGVVVPDTSDVYTIATKAPDGKVSIGHAVGLTDAQQKMQAADKAKRGEAKEELNDR